MATVPASWRFDAIGTGWEIVTELPLPPAVRDEVTARIEAFDRTWSRFRADSDVSALARSGGAIPVPEDASAMLTALAAVSDATAGAVNPLVGASLDALGYDAARLAGIYGTQAARGRAGGIGKGANGRRGLTTGTGVDGERTGIAAGGDGGSAGNGERGPGEFSLVSPIGAFRAARYRR